LVPNISASLRTTLAVEERLAEGQFFKGQTLDKEISLTHGAGTRRLRATRRKGKN
jgi:hypothetical protein